jgi:hypothetical protein
MSILGQERNSTLSQGGKTQNNVPELIASKMHNEYSVNGTPKVVSKPQPSLLDPKTPQQKYTDNLPK